MDVTSCDRRKAHLHFVSQTLEERIDGALAASGNLDDCMAVLAMITFCNLTFKIPRDFLSKVRDKVRAGCERAQTCNP